VDFPGAETGDHTPGKLQGIGEQKRELAGRLERLRRCARALRDAPRPDIRGHRHDPERGENKTREHDQRNNAPSARQLAPWMHHELQRDPGGLRRLGQDAERHERGALPDTFPAQSTRAPQRKGCDNERKTQRGAIGTDHRPPVERGRHHGDQKESPFQVRNDRDRVGSDGGHCDEASNPHQIKQAEEIEAESAADPCRDDVGEVGRRGVGFGSLIEREDAFARVFGGPRRLEAHVFIRDHAIGRPLRPQLVARPLEKTEVILEWRRNENAPAPLLVVNRGDEVALGDAVHAQKMRGFVGAAQWRVDDQRRCPKQSGEQNENHDRGRRRAAAAPGAHRPLVLIRQRCCTRIANRFHFDLHRPSARPPDNAIARRMVPARPMPSPVRKVDRILIDGRNTRRRHHGIRSFKYDSRHVAESSLVSITREPLGSNLAASSDSQLPLSTSRRAGKRSGGPRQL
jgi:hypothetical protein